MNTSKNTSVLIIIFAALIILGIFFVTKSPKEEEQVVCTMDAKLCSDGTYVGRSGPMCTFAECPTTTTISGWKIFTDPAQEIVFQYPEILPTKYTTTNVWPPQVSITGDPFSCIEKGQENTITGQTTKEVINGRDYCVTKSVEGAAGSIYIQYAYATEVEDKVLYFTFTLQAVQCGNFDTEEKNACEAERTTFNLDSLVDQIVQTTKLIK